MTQDSSSEQLPWYKDGLRFQCTECGKCCTGSPGFVWVTEEEVTAIAEFLKISVEIFKRKYTRQRHNRLALIEKKSQNYDCIFLNGRKCDIYQVRPTQCRTYPWWKENLASKQSWELAAQSCEGIHKEAPLVPYSQIVQLLNSNNQTQ